MTDLYIATFPIFQKKKRRRRRYWSAASRGMKKMTDSGLSGGLEGGLADTSGYLNDCRIDSLPVRDEIWSPACTGNGQAMKMG